MAEPNQKETLSRPTRVLSRRSAIKLLGLGATAGAVAGAGYMRFIEPQWLAVTERVIPLSRRPGAEPLRLLHLSDLHASSVVPLDYIHKAVQLGLRCQPDLICLTGDYITGQYSRFREYERVLAPLAKTAPVFATLGNHDGGYWAEKFRGFKSAESVRLLLEAGGIQLLDNQSQSIAIRNRRLNLVGLGDLWAQEFDAVRAFRSTPKDQSATIVLSHNPDSKGALKPFHWDLLLCGHTHGGQLIVPAIGAPFAPVQDKRFIKGLHQWDGRWLHITKGVGNLHGLRLNCRPEISLLHLV